MQYVNFGKAGVKVSPLALGLGLRGQPDENAAQRLIEHAIHNGINLIDCANIYGPMDDRANIGRSEVILGKAIKGKRDDVVITSKVCSHIGQGPNDYGLSRYHIMREIDRSLTRLGTDHIDVYLIHVPDDTTPQEETIRALDDLVRSGKVRYLGCCNHQAWQVCKSLWIADSINATTYMCVQNMYNLLNRDLETEMFGLVREEGLGVMCYSPLSVGLLSGFYSPDEPPPTGSLWERRYPEEYERRMRGATGKVIATLKRLADALGKTPAQLAVAWVVSHPEVTVAISGSDTIEQLNDTLGGVGWELDAAVREELDEVSRSFVRLTAPPF
ncbi:aldo/keto reductase [Candidatus Poribacteria bacterium]|nr:aldo/keto reductase [Candidatus Poribacteria bacterium]MYB63956.1 aldo/keto reductase [Candidatus Poribacteria bacterium]